MGTFLFPAHLYHLVYLRVVKHYTCLPSNQISLGLYCLHMVNFLKMFKFSSESIKDKDIRATKNEDDIKTEPSNGYERTRIEDTSKYIAEDTFNRLKNRTLRIDAMATEKWQELQMIKAKLTDPTLSAKEIRLEQKRQYLLTIWLEEMQKDNFIPFTSIHDSDAIRREIAILNNLPADQRDSRDQATLEMLFKNLDALEETHTEIQEREAA